MTYIAVKFSSEKKMLLPFLTIILFIDLIAIYQFFYIKIPIHFKINDNFIRAYSIFDQPNTLGTFLVALIPLLFILSVYSKKWIKVLLYISLFFTFFALSATFSRGSYTSIFIVFLMFAVINNKNITKQFILPAMISILAFLIPYIFMLTSSFLQTSKLSIDHQDRSFSNTQRFELLISAKNMFLDHPLIGIGIGTFGKNLENYASEELRFSQSIHFNLVTGKTFYDPNKINQIHIVHNTPLQILAETGFIGFIGFIIVISIYLKYIYHSFRIINFQSMPLLIQTGATYGVLAISISSLFGWPFTHGIEELLVLLIILSLVPLTSIHAN